MLKQAGPKKHILLVDDDHAVTKSLTLLLKTRGYEVAVARSGKEAIESVTTDTDLILLDLVLPDQKGFDICRKFKEEEGTRHIPIIILSAKLLSKDIVEGLYLGADDYLVKPFDYEELVARMEAVMRRGSLFRDGSLAEQGEKAIIQELKQIIENESIVPFFQPIILLNPVKLYGLEVLSRPDTQSMLSNPELLFKAAIQFGFYQDLEILSWRKAIEQASKIRKDEKLFLNCNPYLVEGPRFQSIKKLFDDSPIDPKDVVLEITERSAISEYKIFFEHLGRYRSLGFQFAVDDVGGGYASLETIVETKPDIVKIDRHIIRGIHKDRFKQSIVRFIIKFCEENKIVSIAEGIETKEDLDIVRGLGVDAAQGYFIFRPTSSINVRDIMSSVAI